MRKIRKYKKTNVGAGAAAVAAARKSLTERCQLQVDELNYTRFADAFAVGRTWVRLQRLPDGEDWVEQLGLVLQRNSPFEVHCDAAKLGLIREIDHPFAEGTVVLVTFRLIDEPLLVGVNPPRRALQQILAKPLPVAADHTVATISVRVFPFHRSLRWVGVVQSKLE